MERIKKDKEEGEEEGEEKGGEKKKKRRRCRGNGRGESVLHIDEFTTRSDPTLSLNLFLLLPPPRPFPSKEGRSFNPRTVVYDIDEKSMPSLFPSLFSESANRRPPCNFIPPSLICFYSEEREGKRERYTYIYMKDSPPFSPSHIDEFIANTARSIVTKIVYDIDSSFYVNPVSEWLRLTRRTQDGSKLHACTHK